MADRSVVVRLRADVAGFTAQMRVAQQSVADFAGKTNKWALDNKQSLDDVALKAGIAGAALAGLAGIAVAKFADFDQAMSAVKASTGESVDNMELLRDAAIDAGERTAFSATESAAAIEELAKAGISTADILNGGLNGALDLAAAGGLQVADAAEIAASAMSQFSLSGEDVPRIADLLASGANKAQGDVYQLADALKQSGLVAAQFDLDVDETIGTLAAFASNALLGSDAGTSFRTMLLRIANPSNEAKDAFEQLGIAAYDAQGNFVGMESLAGQLQARMSDLTQEQRDAYFATLFGSDAIRAANVLYKEGADGIAGWIAAVDEQGAASETAADRMNNLKGDLEQLSGSFETLLIGLGEGADGPLRNLVQKVTEVVNNFNAMPDSAKTATLSIVGGGGFVLLATAGIAKVISFVAETRQSLIELAGSAKNAGRIVRGIGTGLVIGAVIFEGTRQLSNFMDEWKRARGLILETDGLVTDLDIFGSSGQVTGQLADLEGGLERIGIAITTLEQNAGMGLFGAGGAFSPANVIAGFRSDVRGAEESIRGLDGALSELYATDPASAEAAFLRIREAAGLTSIPIQELADKYFPQYSDALERAAAKSEAAADGQAGFSGVLPEVTQSVEEQAEALKELNEQFFELASQFLDSRAAERALADAIDNFNTVMNDSESTARDREEALDAVAEAQLRVAEGLYADGEGIEAVNARLPAFREQLQIVAERLYGAGADADAFVEAVLASEGLTVNVPVSTPGMGQALTDADRLNWTLRNIPPWVSSTISVTLRETGMPASSTVFGLPSWVYGRASGGYVSGPGGPRDDMVPSWLSNGEYVLAADAVQRLGVPFLDALNSGRMVGFAQGGYVGRTSPETMVRSETISIGQVVAHDYNDFRRQLEREQRLQAMPGARR